MIRLLHVPTDGAAFAFNLRFPGQCFDAETGKHYNYFREHDPGIGRYVKPSLLPKEHVHLATAERPAVQGKLSNL